MKAYDQITDEQLIQMLRDPSEKFKDAITDHLLDKYKPLVRKLSNDFYIMGGETEDLIQEGMIGLFKAIRDYADNKDASFYSFAHLCIRRQILTAMESSQRKKHAPLNSYVSISTDEELPAETAMDSPEQLVIEQEFWEEFYQELWTRLSKLEQEVLKLYKEGQTYTEIAEVMGKEPKAIDNALQRIRKKVSLWNFHELGTTPSAASSQRMKS